MSQLIHINNTYHLIEKPQLLRSLACNKVCFEWLDICEETIGKIEDIIMREIEEQESNYIVSHSQEWRLEWFAFWNLLPSKWYYSNGVYVPPHFRRLGIARRLKGEQYRYAKEISGCLGIITSTRNDNIWAKELLKELWYEISPISGTESLACELKF